MYENLFDKNSQEDMQNFFLHKLAPLGSIKNFSKSQVISDCFNDHICIVVEGKVKQVMYDNNGNEKVLFFLSPGEIFGETSYFSKGDMPVILKSCSNSQISFIPRSILDEFLLKNSFSYNFFMHSLIRKYRISLTQMHDIIFTTSKQKVANTLYRLYIQSPGINDKSMLIDIKLTHQDLANLIGSSRITVTRILKDLRNQDIIDFTNDKKIIIKDFDKLLSLIQV